MNNSNDNDKQQKQFHEQNDGHRRHRTAKHAFDVHKILSIKIFRLSSMRDNSQISTTNRNGIKEGNFVIKTLLNHDFYKNNNNKRESSLENDQFSFSTNWKNINGIRANSKDRRLIQYTTNTYGMDIATG